MLFRFLIAFLLLASLPAAAIAHPINVLLVTGDWKSQAWYQDVVMGAKKKYRGRFIEEKTNQAAPGKCKFTQITNYEAQQYLDDNYLSQFDVVLFGDVVGISLPPHVVASIKRFMENGGGFAYCASYKWQTCLGKQSDLETILPVSMTRPGSNSDWLNWDKFQPDENFKVSVTKPSHPLMRGLTWGESQKLDKLFYVAPKQGAEVLLTAPSGAPCLVASAVGKGRALVSPAIFANDELSGDFCDNWKDVGKFYWQMFEWLAANSQNHVAALKDKSVDVQLNVDLTKSNAPINTGLFGFCGSVFPPNLGKLQGTALSNFEQLNQRGTFSRISDLGFDPYKGPVHFEPERGKFDYSCVDNELAEFERLHLQPEVVIADMMYLQWIWKGGSWANPTDQQIQDCCTYVSDYLKHANHGTGHDTTYKPVVQYIELGNEPSLTNDSIKGYARIYQAVAEHVHKNFPHVKVGAAGGYEVPYVNQLVALLQGKVDFIARHPYGMTPETLFHLQDDFQAHAKSKGFKPLEFFITEWDFWIAGRPKFDYMMRRGFLAAKRNDVIGAMHYRLDQYPEPIYIFGALWANSGPGLGKTGQPIHEVYDSMWIFKDFRGHQAPCAVSCTDPNVSPHFLADASVDKDKASVIAYLDQGYDGTGYSNFAKMERYSQVNVTANLTLAPCREARAMTLATSAGDGLHTATKIADIAPNQSKVTAHFTLHPHTAANLSVGPCRAQ